MVRPGPRLGMVILVGSDPAARRIVVRERNSDIRGVCFPGPVPRSTLLPLRLPGKGFYYIRHFLNAGESTRRLAIQATGSFSLAFSSLRKGPSELSE